MLIQNIKTFSYKKVNCGKKHFTVIQMNWFKSSISSFLLLVNLRCLYVYNITASKDVHALTQKSSSILPITLFNFKLETSPLLFLNVYAQAYKKK